jgi:hypothetical protein
MEMYTQHFSLNFSDIFKYVENAFQIKGAYAPGSQKHMSNMMQSSKVKVTLL